MCEVIHLKRNPSWLKFLPLISDTMIHLQGGDAASDSQVSVPAALLVARSPLIKNILSAGHLTPAFSTPVICIPFVSVGILEIVGKMLFSGTASMDRTRLCGVREVFKLLGIEDFDWMFLKTESMLNDFGNENVGDAFREKTAGDLDKLENSMCIKSEVCDQDVQLDFEHSKIEIIVKLESEPKVENPCSLHNQANQVNSVQSCFRLETSNHKNRVSVIKQLQVDHEGLKHVNTKSEANKDKDKKHTFSSHTYQEKYSSKIRKTCPLCEKRMFRENLPKHIRAVHNKETVKCPHCDKILSCDSLRFI